MIDKLFSEIFQSSSERHDCAICKWAECPAKYVPAQTFQKLHISFFALAVLNPVQYFICPVRTFPARRAFAAGFMSEKTHCPHSNLYNARCIIHNYNTC